MVLHTILVIVAVMSTRQLHVEQQQVTVEIMYAIVGKPHHLALVIALGVD